MNLFHQASTEDKLLSHRKKKLELTQSQDILSVWNLNVWISVRPESEAYFFLSAAEYILSNLSF